MRLRLPAVLAVIGRVLANLVLAGLLFAGGITVFQDHLLYFPETAPLSELLAQAQRGKLRPWPGHDDFRGWLREPDGPARATLVLFHGNAGHAGQRVFYGALARFGLRVLLAEYPGYGPRTGTVGEASLVADAAETLSLARREFGAPVLLAGESLGAGVAAAAYARVPHAASAIWLITPWDRLENVARHHYPWLPVSWLLRDRYDTGAHLRQASVPVAITVAGDDAIVPAKLGYKLHDGLQGAKRLWVIPGAGHNDWPTQADSRWWGEVVDYLIAPATASMARQPRP